MSELSTNAVRGVYAAAPIVTEKNRLPMADLQRNGARFDRWLTGIQFAAWNEGYEARREEDPQSGGERNPYRCTVRGDGLHEWGQCKFARGHADSPYDDGTIHEDEEGHTWLW